MLETTVTQAIRVPADIKLESTRPLPRIPRAVTVLTVVLSTLVALVSYRYLLGVGPRQPTIAGNRFAQPWLPLHAGSAATALLLGAFQFSRRIRHRSPAAHRWTGRVYVLACIVGGTSGIVLAFGSTAGPIATAGFGSLGVVWLVTSIQGWQHVVVGRITEHRAWMTRSFAITLSATTLRLYLAVIIVTGLPFFPAYRAISFLCWVPNLLLAELYLRASRVS